jgi:hypothetical protein
MTTTPVGPDEVLGDCPRCLGLRVWAYDQNHMTNCDLCCPHDKGWWLLRDHYGANNGKYACVACGHAVTPDELLTCQSLAT